VSSSEGGSSRNGSRAGSSARPSLATCVGLRACRVGGRARTRGCTPSSRARTRPSAGGRDGGARAELDASVDPRRSRAVVQEFGRYRPASWRDDLGLPAVVRPAPAPRDALRRGRGPSRPPQDRRRRSLGTAGPRLRRKERDESGIRRRLVTSVHRPSVLVLKGGRSSGRGRRRRTLWRRVVARRRPGG